MSDRTCSIEGCERPYRARGYCATHWTAWRKYGDPLTSKRRPVSTCSIEGCGLPCAGRGWCKPHWSVWRVHGDPLWRPAERSPVCSEDGCDEARYAKGWCELHYRRWVRWGDPLCLGTGYVGLGRVRAPADMDMMERFWLTVDQTGDECWPWTGTRVEDGYGRFSTGNSYAAAHRLAWELANGRPIPPGLFVCHTCDHPWCCRPAHLWTGTAKQNYDDMVSKGRRPPLPLGVAAVNAAKTHCVNGHPLSGDNLYVHPRGQRVCRTCSDASKRRYEETKRATRTA